MKIYYILFIMIFLFTACNSKNDKQQTTNTSIDSEDVNIQKLSFNSLFDRIEPKEFDSSAIKLIPKNAFVLTSGDATNYNSMAAGWGGWGVYFEEPTTWLMLRANRYTLEYIHKYHTYTMCFFDTNYKEQVLFFGSASGRNSNKMKNHKLTIVTTPDGCVAYKEAELIIECQLSQITTVSPDDFYSDKMKIFINDAYKEANDYHKLVFGKITNIWKKR